LYEPVRKDVKSDTGRRELGRSAWQPLTATSILTLRSSPRAPRDGLRVLGLFPLVSFQLGEWIEEAHAEIPAARMARSPITGGRGLMSTAGKVLVVLVMLVSVAWMILGGGVAQLNRNGNEALDKLTTELQKVEEDLASAKVEIRQLRDQTHSTQAHIDRDLNVLRSRQSDEEKARSQISETLSRLRYQLATVEETIKTAQTSLENHNKEHQDEEKAIDDLRTEVKSVKTENTQLMARLQSLRTKFQDTYHQNIEMAHRRQ
jgi:hypothetical protein